MPYLTETIPLPANVFAMLRDLIQERLGLHYDMEKLEIVQNRLAPLVAEKNMDSFVDYYYFLKYDPNNQDEWLRVQTALAVRETYFWREFDQIRLVAQELIPAWQRQRPGQLIRVWHAACASGEEPYSLAMALYENRCFDHGPIEIIGTDFDLESLRMAQEAQYRERAFRSLPQELRRKYFLTHENGRTQLVDFIRSAVQFSYLNLVDSASMALMNNFDIIFCRNVFIYFNDATISQVSNHFYRALNNPGYLFLGAAESLLRIHTQFQLTEMSNCFVYLKNLA